MYNAMSFKTWGELVTFRHRWCQWLSVPGGSVVKNLPANARDTGDVDWIPGSGRSPGEGNGNPLQYSCLETLMDREAWWTIQSMGSQES